MGGLAAVASFAIRQWIRNRIVLASLGGGAAIVAFAVLLGPLMQVEPERLVFDLGLAGIELTGLLILLLVSAITYVDENERRSLTLVLVKPVSRVAYLLGLYAGLCGILLASSASLALFTAAGVGLVGGGPLLGNVAPAAFLLFVEMCVLAALVILFLQFATSLVAAVVYPLGAFVLGAASPTLQWFAENSENASLAVLLRGLRVVVPHFELFNLKNVSPGALPGPAFYAAALGYATAYVAAAGSIAVAAFRRRES